MNKLNIARIFLAIILVVIGMDKFFNFLSICSLMESMSEQEAIIMGGIEIGLGILVFFRIQFIPILYVIALMMGAGVIMHLMNDTYDIGGALLLMCYTLVLVYFNKLQTRNTV